MLVYFKSAYRLCVNYPCFSETKNCFLFPTLVSFSSIGETFKIRFMVSLSQYLSSQEVITYFYYFLRIYGFIPP